MKFAALFTGLIGLASFGTTFAAKSFSASNLYYAAGLKDAQQTTLLQGLQGAGVKVLRVWLDGTTLNMFSLDVTDKSSQVSLRPQKVLLSIRIQLSREIRPRLGMTLYSIVSINSWSKHMATASSF
jgi:hypothetical protein